MQMEGWGVKLVGQSELVQEGGVRQEVGGESKASKEFCNAFTTQYPKLADVGTGVRRTAELDRHVGGRGLHSGKRLLRPVELGSGALRRRGELPSEHLQHSQAS